MWFLVPPAGSSFSKALKGMGFIYNYQEVLELVCY